MKQARIAVPSSMPGGLGATVDAHFGHCEGYTLVDIRDGAVAGVTALPGVPHEHGGCLAAVQHLAQAGVTALVAGGLGMRPLMGFQEAGIEVFKGSAGAPVGEAVEGLLKGALPRFSRESTCGGGHAGHQH